MPIIIDKTIRVRDIIFMVIFVVLAVYALQYDIGAANECIKKYNNCMDIIYKIPNTTMNISEFVFNATNN